jgi:hypothetical protein
MNRCPRCGATGQLTLTPVLAAEPARGYPLPDAHDKTNADAARLSCAACRWRATGPLQGPQAADDGATTRTSCRYGSARTPP